MAELVWFDRKMLMSAWRRVAIEMLPEFRDMIAQAEQPMQLWVQIGAHFQDAFRNGNDDLVRRFFNYAAWCIDTAKPQATDASTAAWCVFYEHIPGVDGLTAQLHRFMPRNRFIQVKDAFRYHIDENGFDRLQKAVLSSYDSSLA
jgi:hypothetical protein